MKLYTINWLLNTKFIFELLYYFAGISVAIGVWVSIKSFLLSKKDISLKYTREINSITGELLRNFYLKILPLFEELQELNEEHFFFDENISIIKLDDKNINESVSSYFDNLSKKEDYSRLAKELLVNIQILSSNFEFGTADINLAKEIIIDKYLDIFESIYPILLKEKSRNLYQSCIDLYNNWRIEKKTIDNQKKKEELQLAAQEIKTFKVNK